MNNANVHVANFTNEPTVWQRYLGVKASHLQTPYHPRLIIRRRRNPFSFQRVRVVLINFPTRRANQFWRIKLSKWTISDLASGWENERTVAAGIVPLWECALQLGEAATTLYLQYPILGTTTMADSVADIRPPEHSTPSTHTDAVLCQNPRPYSPTNYQSTVCSEYIQSAFIFFTTLSPPIFSFSFHARTKMGRWQQCSHPMLPPLP